MKIYEYEATGNSFDLIEVLSKESFFKEYNNYVLNHDGLILIDSSSRIFFYNKDFSPAKLCGNGLRCVALHLFNHDRLNESINIEVDGVYHDLKVVDKNKSIFKVVINYVPFIEKERVIKNHKFYFVDLINKHIVIKVNDLDIKEYDARYLCKYLFSNDYNINFVKIIDRSNIEVKTYERGVGFTLSCGTGSYASSFVLNKLGDVDENINVKTQGGYLLINLKENSLQGESHIMGERYV